MISEPSSPTFPCVSMLTDFLLELLRACPLLDYHLPIVSRCKKQNVSTNSMVVCSRGSLLTYGLRPFALRRVLGFHCKEAFGQDMANPKLA